MLQRMKKNGDKLIRFNNDFIRSEGRLPFLKALRIFEGLWKEGCALGVLPPKDPMEGIETDIRIAAALNSCSKNSCQK